MIFPAILGCDGRWCGAACRMMYVFSDLCPSKCCVFFMMSLRSLYFRRSTRDLDCLRWKRWHTELRWSLRIRRVCRRWQAERFSWTSSVSRILEIYREVADDRVSRGVAAD